MVGDSVDDTQGMAAGRKIELHLLHLGGGRIGKIDSHRAAYGGGHLIHQTAGLAEVHILGVLTHLGDLNGI